MALHFAWDERKAQANMRKHGVSFEEAQSALLDEFVSVVYDEAHSDEEDRWFSIRNVRKWSSFGNRLYRAWFDNPHYYFTKGNIV